MVGAVGSGQPAQAVPTPLHTRCSFGAFVGNEPYGPGPAGLGDHYALERVLGVKLERMVWYADMDQPWPTAAAKQAAKTGHTPHIAWDTGPVTLAQILKGSRDKALDAFFGKAQAFKGTVVLRPWWEMNTVKGRYTVGYSGAGKAVQSLQQYREAWAYLHHRAKVTNGATNVSFFFCANGQDVGPYAMEQYFPGREYVDQVGFDIYNETHWASWTSFEPKLAAMYARVAALHPTAAISIGEIGTVNSGGAPGTNKATWLQDMFRSTAFPRLKHVDFFSVRQGASADWRLDETAAAIGVTREHLAHQ